MSAPVLDANVILRHLLSDHADFSQRADALLSRVERGEITVRIPDTVIFETVFVLDHTYKARKESIADSLSAMTMWPHVVTDFPARLQLAFDLYARYRMSFGDAYVAATAIDTGDASVISFDRDFDRIREIVRVEP